MKRYIRFFSVFLTVLVFLVIPLSESRTAQASSLLINDPSTILKVGETKSLYIIGTSRTVSWSSGSSSVASVSSGGRVTAKAPGSATIYAHVSGRIFTCKVTVLKISTGSATLAAGTTKTLKVYGTSASITWSSGNSSVASVSSGGYVTAKAAGTAAIYASVLGRKFTCNTTVLKISAKSATLTIGAAKTLKVYGTSGSVSWSSGSSSVASVSSTGKVTAKTAGTATITAAVSGIKLYSKITVTAPAPTVTPVPTVTPAPSDQTGILPKPSEKIIGYYAAWARYSGYTPDKIDVAKLTHINYAFANVGSDLKITLGFPDIDEANFTQLNMLKAVNPNLKTIISVGGWTWSDRFSDVALTDESRSAFADSCVDFIVKYGFDGIDIDWEYPVSGGLPANIRRPEDKTDFTLLLKTLRERLDARGSLDGKKYILSFAGAAGQWYSDHTELSSIASYVDYANLMTYDIHGPWESYTGFNAPLYTETAAVLPDSTSADSAVQTWLNEGFPRDKIIMGVPFYGYIYKAVPDINHGLYQTYSGGASIDYNVIAANYLNAPGYVRYIDPISLVPWLFNGSTFITYEDPQSMAAKAGYIKDQALGGAMIWELSQDPEEVLLNSLYQGLKP